MKWIWLLEGPRRPIARGDKSEDMVYMYPETIISKRVSRQGSRLWLYTSPNFAQHLSRVK